MDREQLAADRSWNQGGLNGYTCAGSGGWGYGYVDELTDVGVDGLTDYQEIGSGGFATVYSAYEVGLERRVAVKVLTAIDDAARRRFDRERSSLGRTADHPNIVTPFRSGYTSRGNQPYLVMELLVGGSLQDRLERQGPLPLEEALEITVAVADALDYSHRNGVLHKDIKPANVLLARSGAPKLADFGIAAIQEGTATGQVAYSLHYTAPETFDAHLSPEGALVDPRDERSDLYSLATTLYALVAGAAPFRAPTSASLVNQILHQPPPLIGHAGIDRFLATAMAKKPDERFQNAAEFRARLIALRKGIHARDSAAAESTRPAQVGSSPPVSRPYSPPPPSDRPPLEPPTLPATVEPPPPAGPSDAVKRRIGARRGLMLSVTMVLMAGTAAVISLTRPENPGDGDSSGASESPTATIAGTTGDIEGEEVTLNVRDGIAASATQLSDGRLLSGGIDGAVHLWDPDRPEATQTIYTGHQDLIWTLVELSDGRIASASQDGTVQVWGLDDPATTQVTFRRHEVNARAAIQLPDGRIASAGPGAVHLWDPAAPDAPVASYEGHGGSSVQALLLLPDGRVASAGVGEVHLWDPAQPETTVGVRTIDEFTLGSMAVLSDGLVAMATASGVKIWNPDEPEATVATYTGHANGARALVELDDGRIASGGNDGIRIWRPSDPSTTELVLEFPAAYVLFQLVALEGGRVASAGSGGVSVWDPAQPESTPLTYSGHAAAVQSLVALNDGLIAAGYLDGVRIWDPSRPESPTAIYREHSDWVSSLAILANGRIASSSGDGTIHVWDPAAPESTLATFTVPEGTWVSYLVALNDNRLLAAGYRIPVQIWNLSDPGTLSSDYSGHADGSTIASVTQLADGRVASSSASDLAIHLWDPDSPNRPADILQRRAIRLLGLRGGLAISVAFGLEEVEVWDPAEPEITLGTYRGHTGSVLSLLELQDGRVASAGRDGIHVWDPDNPELTLATISGPRGSAISLIELDDGRIASAGSDGIRIHDLDT